MGKINRYELPQCPYCRGKLWYIEAFLSKNRAVYKCKYCAKKCAVKISQKIFKFLVFVEILSLIVFAAAVFLGGRYCFMGAGIITLIFGVFYFFSPFTVKLLKTKSGNSDNDFSDKKSGKDTDTEIYSN